MAILHAAWFIGTLVSDAVFIFCSACITHSGPTIVHDPYYIDLSFTPFCLMMQYFCRYLKM